MSQLDRQLILLTQEGLPLVSRPFEALAKQLGTSADEVKARFERMLASGCIRRIGAVPNHYKLGYKANAMTVWDVEDSQVHKLGQKLGTLPYVSHCYLRPRQLPEWRYNLFAMVHGKQKSELNACFREMTEILGDACRAHDVLFSTRILKKTGLRFRGDR
ncbi:protein nirH [Hahella sp. CCB-MM4]|nr:protein nirH [Hahella sp. CCB-MM4]